jgi:hypothetical protein
MLRKILLGLISIPLFFLFIYSFSGCQSDLTEPGYNESYMPMNIGNKWYYSSFTHSTQPDPNNITETWEVIGTKNIEGKDFYVIKRNYSIPSSANIDTMYFCYENNKLYQSSKNFESMSYTVSVIADFNLAVNSKFSSRSDLVYDVTVSSKTLNTISFFFDAPGAVDEEHSVSYLKGTGFYELFSAAWGVGKRLVKAELK